jgi:6-pyruvoyltetrahydropterin/6-carboxytetrahydropterin synthase
MEYSIKIYKQYFNFAASHFLLFEDNSRESLHGHNYRVMARGVAPELRDDKVFDFLDIKPIVREVCDSLDHKLLLPKDHPHLKIFDEEPNYLICPPDGSRFSIPKQDTLLLPVSNTSAERLAIYINGEIRNILKSRYSFEFSEFEIEVEETPGQSAVYCFKNSFKENVLKTIS